MTFQKTLTLTVATVAVAFTVNAHAAVVQLVDTDSAHTATNSSPLDFTLSDQGSGNRDGIYSYTYNAGAAFDMLVVSVSRESSSAGQNTGLFPGSDGVFEVSYDGVEMNLATGAVDGSGVSIFYLETNAQSGTIALDFTEFDTVNGIGIGIAAIKSDTGDPIELFDADSLGGGATSVSIDTADDSFTLWAVDTNGGNFNNLTAPQIDKVTDIGSNGFGAAYELVGTGQVGDTYSYTGATKPRGIGAANFVVVPEPASMALLAIGGVLMTWRRR